MRIDRRIDEVKRMYLESKIFDAEDLGHSFIELRHLTPCVTQDVLMGVEEIKFVQRRQPGSRVMVNAGAKVVCDGSLIFYPDDRGRRWAYMLDTKRNRKWLAGQLISPIVEVVDPNIKKEIISLAEELGLATKRAAITDHSFDAYLNAGVPDEVLRKDEEIEELKRQLAEAKTAAKKAKPLAGKTVAKQTPKEE